MDLIECNAQRAEYTLDYLHAGYSMGRLTPCHIHQKGLRDTKSLVARADQRSHALCFELNWISWIV